MSTTSTAPMAARTRALLEAPILATLARLSAPNILNLIAIAGLVTVDGLFAARMSSHALAGVSFVFPWVMLVQHGAASGMGGAVASAIARALGAGQRDRADALAAHAIWLALLLSVVSTAGMLAFGPVIYRWMGADGEAFAHAVSYSTAVFGASACIWLMNLLCSVVRGTGNMTQPSMVILACVAAHAALSPVLMFGMAGFPSLGVAGAGVSLGTAFGVGALYLIVRLRGGSCVVRVRFLDTRLEPALLVEFLRVGIPGMANVVINNITVIILTALAARWGRDVSLAYSVGARLEYIVIPLGFGVGTAIVAMVGTNMGAKRFARMHAAAWTGAGMAAAVCGATGLFFAAMPSLWTGIFTDDPEIVRVATAYLHIVGPAYALYGLGIGFYFACQGAGRLAIAVCANVARLLVAGGLTWLAVERLGGSPAWMFAAIASAFTAYAFLNACAFRRAFRLSKPAP